MHSSPDLVNGDQHDGNGWIVVDEPAARKIPARLESHDGLDLEVLLLSWLVVLLRVQDEGQASFEWSLKAADDELMSSSVSCSSNDLVHSLDVNITDAKARFAEHLATAWKTHEAANTECLSLLVSTRSLSQAPKKFGEDVSHHPRSSPRPTEA